MRYFARLNPAKLDAAFLNREEVLRLSDVGAQLGFGLSVLNERGILRDPNELDASASLPLLTWPFIDFLESLDLSRLRLLELGAGGSTLWLARRFAQVRSLETNPEWRARLAPLLSKNTELCAVDLAALEDGAVEYRDEEMVLVDFAGRRTRFLKRFLAGLGTRRPPAIVLDNADWYRNGAAALAEHGYREIPFHGFKSGQSFVSCTSLFLAPEGLSAPIKRPFHSPAFARRFENDWDQP